MNLYDAELLWPKINTHMVAACVFPQKIYWGLHMRGINKKGGKTMSYNNAEIDRMAWERATMCAVAPSTLRTAHDAWYIPVVLCLCGEICIKINYLLALFWIIQAHTIRKTCTSPTLKLCSLSSHEWQLLTLDVPIHDIFSIADYDQSLRTIPTRPPITPNSLHDRL
jgi:hypothetical protein